MLVRAGAKKMIFQSWEREGIALATARQWQPKLKSRAQVNRKRTIPGSKRGKVTPRKCDPLDFAMSPERLAIMEKTADFSKIFGAVFQPEYTFHPNRGRRTNESKINAERINLDLI